jgi:hypothetical protein
MISFKWRHKELAYKRNVHQGEERMALFLSCCR